MKNVLTSIAAIIMLVGTLYFGYFALTVGIEEISRIHEEATTSAPVEQTTTVQTPAPGSAEYAAGQILFIDDVPSRLAGDDPNGLALDYVNETHKKKFASADEFLDWLYGRDDESIETDHWLNLESESRFAKYDFSSVGEWWGLTYNKPYDPDNPSLDYLNWVHYKNFETMEDFENWGYGIEVQEPQPGSISSLPIGQGLMSISDLAVKMANGEPNIVYDAEGRVIGEFAGRANEWVEDSGLVGSSIMDLAPTVLIVLILMAVVPRGFISGLFRRKH